MKRSERNESETTKRGGDVFDNVSCVTNGVASARVEQSVTPSVCSSVCTSSARLDFLQARKSQRDTSLL